VCVCVPLPRRQVYHLLVGSSLFMDVHPGR
jgi:hypothetical protein